MTTPPLAAPELAAERRAVAAEVAAMVRPRALVACAGFGLSSIPITEAGYAVTGIEIDDAIAAVNRANGGDCITADFLDVDPRQFAGIEMFQISPPCTRISQANVNAAESPVDVAIARQTCRYIRTLRPKFFLLENVWLYRQSESWRLILHCLKQTGYKVGLWRLCSADYGSAQTRHRMIVVARRDGVRPHKPFPTHAKTPDMFCQQWNGWLDAIIDLVPYLPDSEFADWNKARMPAELLESILAPTNGENTSYFEADSPAPTICASHVAHKSRAFIVDQLNGSRPPTIRLAHEPAPTLVNYTVKHPGPRAFIVDDRASNGGAEIMRRESSEPVFLVTRPASKIRGFVVSGFNASHPATVKCDDEPIWTVCANEFRRPASVTRGVVGGRTVSMIPRCYARWQDLPDDFGLPATKAYRQRTGRFLVAFADEFTPGNVDNELACRGIGNGVPLNLTRAALRSLADVAPGRARGKGEGR